MINRITGILAGKSADGVYISAGGGIEWDITMSGACSRDLEAHSGEKGGVSVFVWLYHRDDQMKLFGFATEERRRTFLELLKVEGIGPKAALKIIGGINQNELEAALEAGDLARLEAVPGLGKKTAQKMLLALKGKLVQSKAAQNASPFNDLAEALAGMGYDKRLAVEALSRAAQEASLPPEGPERENALFRKAIYYLTL
ncbi:MAG: Holliday junction branch migration protein RuvA [Spirochaetaceae bacterium]|jgi:Holliday junction DNA helicase RuvA|nr:Holliday junction branch migration protein RuvA [Spirochaetaceae bacterium]